VITLLERRMRERQAYVARHAFPTRGDKAVRAQSIRGRMALDGLHLPRSVPWRQAFKAELLTFPAGRHDDQVDALGLVGQLLDRMVKGSAPKPQQDEREDRYAKLFANDDEGATSWKIV
jgi:phage terminase large subunit-like protein